jgi:hypothetical protein
LRLATITTFTTNHDHEDQRWLQAHKRRTLHAYHACLTDFTLTFLVTFSLLPVILRGYWIFTHHLLFTTPITKRQVLSSSAERLPYTVFTIGLGEQALKHSQIYNTNMKVLPISAKEFLFFLIRELDFWHLPFRGIYPHGPICFCYFSPFPSWRVSLFFFMTIHTTCVHWASNCSWKLSVAANERLCLFGLARKRASERAERGICTDGSGTGISSLIALLVPNDKTDKMHKF